MDDFSQLNDALLVAEGDEDEKQPKRNTKDSLISKIVRLHEEQHVPLEYSNTKLRRMTKQQLGAVLGGMLQEAARGQMARQVGADPATATDATIALGALRMVHDIAASATERAANAFLPDYGYEVDGFTEALKDPTVREATDACLTEIAQDTDVLQYIESPWSRLGIAWLGAMASSVRQARPKPRPTIKRLSKAHESPAGVGPPPIGRQNTV